MYHRSPAAYDALRSWDIFNLPSRASLKQFTTTCLHGDGVYFDYLRDQSQKYALYKEECVKKNIKEPRGDGVIILDEVKVVGKVAWNCGSGKIIGLAMDTKDVPTLADFDETDDEPKAAEYFLQFLWRDLTSDFDVIGPHYSTQRSMDCAFTLACFTETLDAFQSYGFKVGLVTKLFALTVKS